MLSIKKTDQLCVKLKQKLQLVSINQLAIQTGFVRRKPKKIKPLNFLLGLFITMLTGANSLSLFASTLGLLGWGCISKQAIDKRMKQPLVHFLESVLAKVLSYNDVQLKYKKSLRAIFNRIIVQDSTSIQLDSKLAQYFPGSNNQHHQKTAIVKI